jgi:hypothetical protein
LQIDVEALLPAGLVIGAAEPRGVVYEDVDAAERRGGFRDVAGDLRRLGEVAHRGMRLVPVSGDLVARPRQGLGAAGADRHRGARLGAGQRDRPPDAAAAAAHHHPLARQIDVHGRRASPESI